MTIEQLAKIHREWLSKAPRERVIHIRSKRGDQAILFFTGDVTGYATGVAVQYSEGITHIVLVDQISEANSWELIDET